MTWEQEKEDLGRELIGMLYDAGMILTWYRDKPDGWTLKSGIWSPVFIQLRKIASLPNRQNIRKGRLCNGKNDKLPEARWYRKPIRADLPVKDRKKYILAAIPNIGNRLAENLLSEFNTISNVANASVAELRKVPKIGEKKADLIFRILH